jgi:hypothetical protein
MENQEGLLEDNPVDQVQKQGMMNQWVIKNILQQLVGHNSQPVKEVYQDMDSRQWDARDMVKMLLCNKAQCE